MSIFRGKLIFPCTISNHNQARLSIFAIFLFSIEIEFKFPAATLTFAYHDSGLNLLGLVAV